MSSNNCPIIQSYISEIKSFVETAGLQTLYDNELAAINTIASDHNLRLGGFDLTCLRGFMCIDWMCGAINSFEWSDPIRVSLPSRSWQGLTELKSWLDDREKVISLDRAEYQLGGVVTGDGITPTKVLQPDQVRKVLATADRSLILASTIAAIVLMRPFLKNQKGPVGGVGKYFYRINVTTGTPISKMVDYLIQLSTVKYERLPE